MRPREEQQPVTPPPQNEVAWTAAAEASRSSILFRSKARPCYMFYASPAMAAKQAMKITLLSLGTCGYHVQTKPICRTRARESYASLTKELKEDRNKKRGDSRKRRKDESIDHGSQDSTTKMATPDRTIKWAVGLDIGLSGAVLAVATFAISQLELRIRVIGIICACFNVLMCASPLTAVINVIQHENVDAMPFWLSFFLFLNGGVWLVYGIIDRDMLIGIPNGIGFLLGTIQLIVYAIYANFIHCRRLRLFLRGLVGRQALVAPLLPNAVEGQEA
uniref:Bidirectional sugar transporter SWEET n=1 Tax=Oryza glumipatula TaxID=40148 RepID=A0A0D9Y7I2_9ORYZ